MNERSSISGFRELFEAISSYSGSSLFSDILSPSIPACLSLMAPLEKYRHRNTTLHPYEADSASQFSLYALSRIADQILSQILGVSKCEYVQFFTALGFRTFEADGPFHPFWHEATQAYNPGGERGLDPVRVVWTVWPGLAHGDLLFMRAGCFVEADKDVLDADVLNDSWLYGAYRRPNRTTRDLSFGWGSNSQWGTRFRRDYAEPSHYFFNWGEERDLGDPSTLGASDASNPGGLARRRELLVYRCRVRPDRKPVDPEDEFPFLDALCLRRTPQLSTISDDLIVPLAAVAR